MNATATATAEKILDRWANAIAARDLDAISALFAAEAVFVATAPAPLVGQRQIRAYYAAAPEGLTAKAALVLAVGQPDGLALVADVRFDLPDGKSLQGRLSLCCEKTGRIRLYHLAVNGPSA